MDLAHELGQRVAKLRRESGFTQEDLARRANISISFCSMIERGDRLPHINTIQDIANALQVSISYLISFLDDVESRQGWKVEPWISPLVEYIRCRELGREKINRLLDVAKAMYGDIPTNNSVPANGS